MSSSSNFIDAFAADQWEKPVVLLIDELSEILLASEQIQMEFLRALRTIRHTGRESAIASVIAAGIFSLMRLSTSKSDLSPFNTSSSVQMPYFSREATRKIFGMFAEDNYIHIDEAVIDDIWAKSNGYVHFARPSICLFLLRHPGIVCICGEMVSDNLESLLDHKLRSIPYAHWQTFPVSDLHDEVLAHNTFRSMVNFLKAPEARDAITLFRTVFAGFLGEVRLLDTDEDLADFLTSMGVLSRPNTGSLKYRVTSPLIDSLIRRRVIPAQFSSAPIISPLGFCPRSLHIPRVLQEALKCFDKELMQMARWRSYKVPTVRVQGYSNIQVPRESVYDTELMRILCNWVQQYGWFVSTGQWHSNTSEGRHQFSDIVLRNPDSKIILELLATANEKSIKDHITKIPKHMSSLSAHEGWVIHFTCEDNFTPIWQSSSQLDDGVNMIHLVHDLDFTQIVMHSRWRDWTGAEQKASYDITLGH